MMKSCISRRGAAFASSSGLKLRASQIVPLRAAYSTESDRNAQVKFNSLSGVGQAASQLLDSAERQKFHEMQRKKILPQDSILWAVWVYICLQNPLLKKYSIDPAELLKGAKYGFEVAYTAMFAADLRDFALGEVKESPSNDLLVDTFNSRLYAAALGAAQDTKTKNVTSKIINLDIVNVSLRNISTQIVPGDVPEETEFMTDEERSWWLELNPELNKRQTERQAVADSVDKALSDSTSAVSNSAPATIVKSADVAPTAAVLSKPAVSPPPSSAGATSIGSVDNADGKVAFSPQPATRAALKSVVPKPAESVTASTSSSAVASNPTSTQASNVSPTSSAAAAEPAPNSTGTSADTASAADPQSATDTAEGTSAAKADPTVPPVEKYLSAYPPGSVVASVDVQFDIREEYETTLDGVEGALGTIKHARSTSPGWTFRGCISGQVPLQWRVVAFNGLGSRDSKY